MFRARLPSIFSTCQKMPRLPRNLHLVTTWRSPANAIYKNAQQDTSKVLRLPRKMTMDTSKVLRLPRKLQHIVWKRHKSIAPATQNDSQHVAKHVWMSQSATPATRNEATTRLTLPKLTTSAELPIGTAIWSSRGRLRTVADGCERLRPWTQRLANTPSTPRPPEWNGNPCYAFGKNKLSSLTRWERNPFMDCDPQHIKGSRINIIIKYHQISSIVVSDNPNISRVEKSPLV